MKYEYGKQIKYANMEFVFNIMAIMMALVWCVLFDLWQCIQSIRAILNVRNFVVFFFVFMQNRERIKARSLWTENETRIGRVNFREERF